ncbi:MAG: transporter substrate-binding domain-containing protein, partial [Candidatus Promineifilaceae bacterium]|nr:transporter substrate-binding domain-containing protein [Candidatus Promineifilaceae bacterium]
KEIEPFVFVEQDRFTGFSIDLWKEVALHAGLNFEIVKVETVAEQLDAVKSGKADVAIAAISMTPEREEDLDFSYPYFRAGLQILTVGEPVSIFSQLFSFVFSSGFLVGLAGIMVILLVIGHIVWLVERQNNPDFPRGYWNGVWEGLWWAAVTVTTVGYGDKTVKDKWGRLLGIFWMFAGLFLVANFTAFVTAEATVSRLETSINGIEDLSGKRVVTIEGTTPADYLQKEGIPFRSTKTVEEAYSLLENDRADAIVYDAPVLQYHVASTPHTGLKLVGSPFQHDDYGIAMAPNSKYEEVINQALLELQVNGTYDELLAKWHLSIEG